MVIRPICALVKLHFVYNLAKQNMLINKYSINCVVLDRILKYIYIYVYICVCVCIKLVDQVAQSV